MNTPVIRVHSRVFAARDFRAGRAPSLLQKALRVGISEKLLQYPLLSDRDIVRLEFFTIYIISSAWLIFSEIPNPA